MNTRNPSFGHPHAANAPSGVFPGLVGITEPFTDLVAGALSALRGIRSSLRQRAQRRHTLAALRRLDPRLLADIGLEPGDLIEAETRSLPIQVLARRRHATSRRPAGRLDAALASRRPAVNDESYRLVA